MVLPRLGGQALSFLVAQESPPRGKVLETTIKGTGDTSLNYRFPLTVEIALVQLGG